MKNVVIYGAGVMSVAAYGITKHSGTIPVAICDGNSFKQGKRKYFGKNSYLEILSYDDIVVKYPECYFYVSPTTDKKYSIIDELIRHRGISKERIINYEPYEKRLGCNAEETLVLEEENIQVCCNATDDVIIPMFSFESMTNEQMYTQYIATKSKMYSSFEEHMGLCERCPDIKFDYFCKEKNKITTIAFGTGFVCQFKCVYCKHIQKQRDIKCSLANVDKMISFINWLKEKNKISTKTFVSIANGELTVNPKMKEILDCFSEHPCSFLSNGQIFRQEIADVMHNGRSYLCVSLDSGTKKTFRGVKGVDGFDDVIENIKRYAEYGVVELKYILIPGANDDKVNIECFLEFAKSVNAAVILSRDIYGNEQFEKDIEKSVKSAIYFLKYADNLGILSSVQPSFFNSKHSAYIHECIEKAGSNL